MQTNPKKINLHEVLRDKLQFLIYRFSL